MQKQVQRRPSPVAAAVIISTSIYRRAIGRPGAKCALHTGSQATPFLSGGCPVRGALPKSDRQGCLRAPPRIKFLGLLRQLLQHNLSKRDEASAMNEVW